MSKSIHRHGNLARNVKSGDQISFDILIEKYYASLCAYAYSLTHDKFSAEDLVQNVYAELWIKRANINPQLSIKSYLYNSVYNNFVDEYRKKKPIVYLEKKYIEALDNVIEDESKDLGKLFIQLEKEISKLPPRCRRIFLLNKKDGLTHLEISEYLQISIKTVEGHITRAFKLLQERLGEQTETVLFLLFYKDHRSLS